MKLQNEDDEEYQSVDFTNNRQDDALMSAEKYDYQVKASLI